MANAAIRGNKRPTEDRALRSMARDDLAELLEECLTELCNRRIHVRVAPYRSLGRPPGSKNGHSKKLHAFYASK